MKALKIIYIVVFALFTRHSYCQVWPASNINVCGSYSSNENFEQHKGIDIWGDPVGTANPMQVIAAYDGTITKIIKFIAPLGSACNILVEVEQNNQKFYIFYGHCNFDNSLVDKRKLKKGEHFAYIATTEVAGTSFPHLHFNYQTGEDFNKDNLDPLEQTFAAGNRDPGNNAPEFGPLFIKQPENNGLYINRTPLYGKVKIIREITDNMGHTEPINIVKKFDNDAYPIIPAKNETIKSIISSPHLIRFSIENSEGEIIFPIDNNRVPTEVQIDFNGHPKLNFNMLFDINKESIVTTTERIAVRNYCYDLTNITTANEISPIHMYWNTRLKKGELWNGSDAGIINEAAFPDGKYKLNMQAEDLGGHAPFDNQEVIVDNFPPYVSKLEVIAGEKIYELSRSWDETSGSLIIKPNTLSGQVVCGEDFQVIVTTNEPMREVTLGISSTSYKLISETPKANSDSKIWEFTVPADAYSEIPKGEKDFTLVISGYDVSESENASESENEIYGLPNDATSFSAVNYPHRNADGSWSTPMNEGDKHILQKGRLNIEVLSQKNVTCYDDENGQVIISIYGGEPPYYYNLSFKQGSTKKIYKEGNFNADVYSITNLKAGDYILQVSDIKGCIGEQEITIQQPSKLTLSISGGGLLHNCDHFPNITLTASASGGTPPYRYSWPGGILNVHSSGIYECKVFDANDCTASSSAFVGIISVLCAFDPNIIAGPEGFDKQKYVSVNDNLLYTIKFENDPDFATAPAQKVVITLPIDYSVNINSLELSDFGFANRIFQVPANRNYYTTRLDVRDSLGIYVDVTAGIDVLKNEAFWIFESIDPVTGLSPDDPKIGLLPINNKQTHNGEGFVNFLIKPQRTIHTGDSIRAKASIVFDKNEPISTNVWVNTIDAKGPVSSILPVSQQQGNNSAILLWKGVDDTGGSGIYSCKLYYSENNGPFKQFKEGVQDTFFVFTGKNGSFYRFFSQAKDNTGNEEALKNIAEASVTFGNIAILSPSFNNHFCPDDTIPIRWSAMGIDQVNIEISPDGGINYSSLINGWSVADSVYNWPIPSGIQPSDNYVVKLSNPDNPSFFAFSDTFSVYSKPDANAGSDVSICIGDTLQLNATGGVAYEWNNINDLNNAYISNPVARPLISKSYIVTVTGSNGCKSQDAINVVVNDLPLVEFSSLNLAYCLNSDTVELTGLPSGGVFIGNGIVYNSFIPLLAGVGTHQLTYSYTDQNSCIASQTKSVTVNDVPEVSISGLNTKYCINDIDVLLTVTPTDGLLSGDGISGNSFSPASAGIGMHQITYSYTDPNGCSAGQTQSVTVNYLPIVSFSGLNTQCCINATDVLLTGTPVGGTFSGDGISGNSFSPALAGIGTHQITYSYTDLNGCSNSHTQSVTVNNLPTVSFTGLNSEYNINDPADTLTGIPAGGVFSGNGIIGDIFNPADAGAGSHSITYTYTIGGCTNAYSQSTIVTTVSEFAVVIYATNPTCYGECNGSATAKAEGGSGNYLYLWKIHKFPFRHIHKYGQTVNNLCAGEITVYVYDLTSRKVINNKVTLTEPSALNIDLVFSNTKKPNCNKNCNGYASIDESQIGGVAPYNYSWFVKAWFGKYIKINQENDNTIDQLCEGQYKVKVTDNNNCSEEKYFSIKCEKKQPNNSWPWSKNSIVVYPNPAKNNFTIELHFNDEIYGEVYLLNILGRKVMQVKQGTLGNEKIEVDAKNLHEGVYFINVNTKEEILIEKVIIKK